MRLFRRKEAEPAEHRSVAEAKKVLSEEDTSADLYLPKATIKILRDFLTTWNQRFPRPESLGEVIHSKLDSCLGEPSFNSEELLEVNLNHREVIFFMQVLLAAAGMGDEMSDRLGIKDENSPERRAIGDLSDAYVFAVESQDRSKP